MGIPDNVSGRRGPGLSTAVFLGHVKGEVPGRGCSYPKEILFMLGPVDVSSDSWRGLSELLERSLVMSGRKGSLSLPVLSKGIASECLILWAVVLPEDQE